MTDRINIIIANSKEASCGLSIVVFSFDLGPFYKGQRQGHAYFDCEHLTTHVKANSTTAPNIMSHVGFRLAYLELNLTYSKGQLGRTNGISPDILTFLLISLFNLLAHPVCNFVR